MFVVMLLFLMLARCVENLYWLRRRMGALRSVVCVSAAKLQGAIG